MSRRAWHPACYDVVDPQRIYKAMNASDWYGHTLRSVHADLPRLCDIA